MSPTYKNLKLVVIINKDLKMGKGKVFAQFGHAIHGVIDSLQHNKDLKKAWEREGSPLICLKASLDEIKLKKKLAKQVNILTHSIYDAGRTQVAAGSNTILSIGPAPIEILDKITGDLKLY